MPFYNYSDIWNGIDYKRELMEILLNVALFVPIGFLLGRIIPKGFVKVLLIGCMLSFLIELLQLATGRGLCETNDVIHNTVGCMVGYAIAMGLKKLINWINNALKNFTMESDNTIFDLQQSHVDTEFVVKNANLELEVCAEILKTAYDIPYIGSILKLSKVARNFMDYRFFRKLGRFLKYANNIPESEMKEFLDSISTEDKKRISDYLTQLLYTAEDDAKADLMGKIYKRRAVREIDDYMMLRLCSIVSRSFISDLEHLSDYLQVSENNTFITDNLVALGLLSDCGNMYDDTINGFESPGFGPTKHKLNQVGLTLYQIITDDPIIE